MKNVRRMMLAGLGAALLATPAVVEAKPKRLEARVTAGPKKPSAPNLEARANLRRPRLRPIVPRLQPAVSLPVAHAAPELDPAGAAAVAMILVGSGAILVGRRRRRD